MSVAPQPSLSLTIEQRRRISARVASGWPLADAAAMEGILEGFVSELEGDAELTALIEAHRHLACQGHQERLKRLVQMAWIGLEAALYEGDARLALFILKEEIAGRQPLKAMARVMVNTDTPPPKNMTAFVPPSWQKQLFPAARNAAPTGRWCPAPKTLSTMQMIYLRIRTQNRTLAFGSKTPAASEKGIEEKSIDETRPDM